MITKPKRIIKRILKAVGQKQPVLLIGDWDPELIKGIKENQNSLTQLSVLSPQSQTLEDNSFTRIIADYNSLPLFFLSELRRLLLPTGQIIITADSEEWIIEKIFNFITKSNSKKDIDSKKIKPRQLQDLIHDHGFLIEAYNGYPRGHLIMIAEIQNKEVSTLFSSEKQATIKV